MPHFLLREADKSFDRAPINYQDSVMSNIPLTREFFTYATPLSCDYSPQNVTALDPDKEKTM